MSLIALLQEEIRQSGCLSLSRYMTQCLYHPIYGYYKKGNPLGKEGDFITSPEISSLFGWVVRGALELLAKEQSFEEAYLVDLGGGRGTLMKDMIELERRLWPERSHMIVETSPMLQSIQQENLQGSSVQWLNDWQGVVDASKGLPLLLVANEFFDAFPIDQYVFEETGWHERVVDMDPRDRLVFKTRPTNFRPSSLYHKPKIGDCFEDMTPALDYGRRIFRSLKQQGGVFILIDYGYDGFHYGDTLQAVLQHQFQGVLDLPGDCDVTYHINFEALRMVAQEEGLRTLPLLTQGDFLKHYGLEAYQQRGGGKDCSFVKDAVQKLINPSGMGSLFKVMIITS